MNTRPQTLLVLLLTSLFGFAGANAVADVIIQDSDISGGQYIYELSYADLDPTPPTKFEVDKYAKQNVRVLQQVGGERSVAAWSGNTFARIEYKFDFSNSDYRPTSVSIDDAIGLGNVDDLDVTIDWSTDGSNWTVLRTVDTDLSGTVYNHIATNQIVNLPGQPDAFYYQVYFAVDPNDSDGIITNQDVNQWSRQRFLGDPNPGFSATFDVVEIPEPASLTLLASFGGLLLTRRFRGR